MAKQWRWGIKRAWMKQSATGAQRSKLLVLHRQTFLPYTCGPHPREMWPLSGHLAMSRDMSGKGEGSASGKREPSEGDVGVTVVKGEREGRWIEQDKPQTTAWPRKSRGQAEESRSTCCPSEQACIRPSASVPTTLTGEELPGKTMALARRPWWMHG